MLIHLFASDPSVFLLLPTLAEGNEIRAIIYPGNRASSDKVAALRDQVGDIPVFEHCRGELLPDEVPDAECAVSWFYSQILPTQVLDRYSPGILNMHGGALPDYRGASVLHWAIVNGETELGITWHSLVEEVDAGPIWAETRIPLPASATAAEMRHKMITAAIDLFPDAWSKFRAGGEPIRVPDVARGCVWPQRYPKDGLIEPGWPEARLRNLVRALCPPWPPAYAMVSEEPFAVEIISERPIDGAIPYRTEEGRTVYLCASEGTVPL